MRMLRRLMLRGRRRSALTVRKCGAQAHPVERGARIGLSPGRNIAVADDIGDRIARKERSAQARERLVLSLGEGNVLGPFKFDSDGKVVAVFTSGVARLACMPCALAAWHELHDLAVAPDQEMRGHPKSPQGFEIGVGSAIETVGEQANHRLPTELARRKTDGVNDQQRDRLALGPFVAIGGQDEVRSFQQALAVEPQGTHPLETAARAGVPGETLMSEEVIVLPATG